jgi:predicted O-methyltransferase YrrM
MSSTPHFDWRNALEYLEELLPQDVQGPAASAAPGPAQPTIGPWVAQLVDVLIYALRPSRVLEIGTSTGYSAMAMGRALKQVGGTLTTIEIDPELAAVARRNITEAGLDDVIDVLVDDANEAIAHVHDTFGLILQDGNKDDYLRMLSRLIELLAPQGLLVTDDVLFPVMQIPQEAKRWQYALSLYNQALQNQPELQTVWLPIGDGVAISVRMDV